MRETQITTTKGPNPPGFEHQHRQFEGQVNLCNSGSRFPYSKETTETSVIISRKGVKSEVDLLTRSADSCFPPFCRAMASVRGMSRETCRSSRSGSRPLTMSEDVQLQNPTRLPYILTATIHRPIGSEKRTTHLLKSAVTQQNDGMCGETRLCLHICSNTIYGDG